MSSRPMSARSSAPGDEGRWDTDLVAFRSSGIHGLGGFARRRIRSGRRIIEYVGRQITKAESARLCEDQNVYIFTLDDDRDLDGNVDWNPARWLNQSARRSTTTE